ncbi:MAG: GGDEF domain-containing protein [Deltaproteobacteria bacterium]|nr:GGDEF domain-containing protein [Deltaproteobacteria bacterium]
MLRPVRVVLYDRRTVSERRDRGTTTNPNKTVVTVITPVQKKTDLKEACLVVIYGDELGKKVPLGSGSIIIGRSSKCDIQVDQESVSRNHAKMKNTGKFFTIRDLGSTNGTYVNDELVDEANLRDGDQVKIGRTIFKFLSGGNMETAYHEEIYRLMTVDGLTQVHNRRYFLEAVEREISRCHRYGRALTLIMFDIDHFKSINDTYGHLAGDAVLRQLCQVVKAKIRREDLLARYGGEEFGIILPEIDGENAVLTADKIRRLVEKTPFRFEDTRIPVTISLGVAECHPDCKDPSELIKKADEYLYQAKNSGRNKVCP